MLLIKCDLCKKEFWVKGHTTPGVFYETGEVIIDDREDFSETCEHLREGQLYEIVDEEYPDEDGYN